MVDRCVCCGAVVPEGTEVCINCRYQYLEPGRTQSEPLTDPSVFKTKFLEKQKKPSTPSGQKS